MRVVVMRKLGFLSIVAAIVLAGCSSEDANKLSSDAKNLAQDAGQAIGGLTLAGKVQAALRLRKDIDANGLHVEAKDGIVTITGHVKSADEKARVFDIANNTVGVDKVINTDLKVEP
jgi:osmotically-inducible protein OsmY